MLSLTMLREIFNKETISIMKLLTLNWIGCKLDICPDKNIFVCNRLGEKKTPEILILVKAKHCFYFFFLLVWSPPATP